VDAMKKIREEDVEIVKNAPHTMPVARVNEAKAVKEPILTWKDVK